MHIGLIGGIGPAATEFYYRNLVKRQKQAGTVMELTIVHADTATLINHFNQRAYAAQVDDYMKYVKRLQAAGCDAIATTSMAGHFCIEQLIEASPLPMINAIPMIDDYFSTHGIKRVGILGTDDVMKSKLYGGITSAEDLQHFSFLMTHKDSPLAKIMIQSFQEDGLWVKHYHRTCGLVSNS